MIDSFTKQAQVTDAELPKDLQRLPASLIESFLTSLPGTS